MIFNSKVDIYQPTITFEHGETAAPYTLYAANPLHCHLKFTGSEQLSANRKRSTRRAKVSYENSPVVLTARDVLKIDGVYFRLLHTPTSRKGLANRTFYEVDIVEDFNVVVS